MMPTEIIKEEERNDITIPEVVTKKFGERYKEEIPVRIGKYDFYADIFSFGEDLSSQLGTRWSPEGRNNFLKQELIREQLELAAKMLQRYEVPQEMIKGVGRMGSVLYLSLSKGEKDGKILGKKILFFENRGVISMQSEKDLGDFGIPSIDLGMERIIPIFEDNAKIEQGNELNELVVDNVYDRVRYLVQEMGRTGSRRGLEKEIPQVLTLFGETTGNSEDRVNTVLAAFLGKMGMVDSKIELPNGSDGVEIAGKRQFKNIFENSLRSLVLAMERNEYLSKERKMEVGFEEGVFGRVERMLMDGQNVLVTLPEGLSFLPALYLSIQEIADKYKNEAQKTANKEDIKEYWNRVVYETDKVTGLKEVLILVQDIYNDGWDEESGIRPDVSLKLEHFEKIGVKVSLVDMTTEDIFEIKAGRMVKVGERGPNGRAIEL